VHLLIFVLYLKCYGKQEFELFLNLFFALEYVAPTQFEALAAAIFTYMVGPYLIIFCRSDISLKGLKKCIQRAGLEPLAICAEDISCFRNVQCCSDKPR